VAFGLHGGAALYVTRNSPRSTYVTKPFFYFLTEPPMKEGLAKAQKRNFKIASGSVGGSDDERDTKEEAWASVFASTSAAGAESAQEQRRRKLQRKAVPAKAAAPATAAKAAAPAANTASRTNAGCAKAVAPEALMGVDLDDEDEDVEEEGDDEEEGEEEGEDDDEEEEEEGGMPLVPPTIEAILKGTKRGAAAAAPAAPPSKKGKSTHETAQPTAPPPKPAPLAAANPATPAPAPASEGGFGIDPEVKRELSALDNDLAEVLERGDIALVGAKWLKAQLARQPDYRIVRRQDLKPVGGITPHLEPEEAKRLLLKGERAIGAFSLGWPTSGNPDPTGHRIEALWRALQERPDIEAFFWDFPSLYQNSDQSPRTEEQERAFKRGLGVMGHIYASAIGTTVLQLKELPLRPPEYDGKLCLFDLAPGVDGAAIKTALESHGDIVSCTLGRFGSMTVCFTTHAAAQAAKRAAAQLAHIAGGVDTLFNERSYDGRHGEAGLDDDEGRGWCVFESAVSGELIVRLSAIPRVKAELDKLPPKMLQLRSGCPLETVDLSAGRLETRVAEVVARIEGATFTGKGDKAMVVGLYKKYVDRIAGALQRVLPKMLASDGATAAPAELPPLVDAPVAAALRLAEGQPLLLLSRQGSGAGGGPRFGIVDATGGRVALTVTGGDDAELAYDRCSQAVLPWRPPAAGWDAAFVGDALALRDLAEPARRLADDARRLADDAGQMELESELRTVGEQAREIADGAARCQTIAHAAREAGGAVWSCVDEAAARFSQGDSKQREAALDKVRAVVERLQPEAMVTAALRSSGASGARRYAAGQPLTVRTAGGWRDADVATAGVDGLCHLLTFGGSGEPPATLTLHPWNHAPRELPHAAYEAMRAWWAPWLGAQHARIADALTGKRLDALQQCVAINVTGGVAETQASAIRDALSLTAWLLAQHGARLEGGPAEGPLAALLTAGPASGKTTLLSQVVMIALQDERRELVPILVKVQVLQRRLLEAPDTFAGSWNYIDAFLRLEHEASRPALYRMLRQAMMARRALLLIDGLDEAGAKRAEIERHVVEVLAPQGHVLLCTSRPAGVDEARFSAFRRLALAPLSDAQQERALELRLGTERAAALLTYVRDVMPRDDTGQKVTSNPLMLSMVAAVYELRQGVGMPGTVAELYATASDAMLARGGVKTPELARLLQRIFFEAHVAQRRLIEDRQLDEAALVLEAPEALAKIRAEAAAMAFEPFSGRAEMGHYIEVTKEGEHKGKRGLITTDDKSGNPYKVTFANGTVSDWLRPNELRSSGLAETAVLQRAMDASVPAVRAACEARLSVALREALRTVRERVLVDALPLLSLWQSEPLQLQSSHLSFQEYFAAIALCDEGTELSGTLPWQWPAWWANAVELGAEIPGDRFGHGLLRAAGVTGDTLDLSEKLGGHRPTVRRVLATMMKTTELKNCNLLKNNLDFKSATMLAKIGTEEGIMLSGMTRDQTEARFSNQMLQHTDAILIGSDLKLMAVLTELSLWNNSIGPEGAIAIAEALKVNAVLTKLCLSENNIGAKGAKAIAEALKVNPVVTALFLSNNEIGPGGAVAIAEALKVNVVLTELSLWNNSIGPGGAIAIAEALKVNTVLTNLKLSMNNIGVDGAKAIAEALKVNAVLTELWLNSNNIGVDGANAIAEALKVNTVLTTLWLNSNTIGDKSAKAIAEALTSGTAVLTNVYLYGNNIGDDGAKAIAKALKANAVLTELSLGGNNIGNDGAKAIAEGLKFNAVLTKLFLWDNNMGDAGKQGVRDVVKGRCGFKLKL
jgi:Ran GTPase-activating protein (RanGAP) involved in mRNA processing and transport